MECADPMKGDFPISMLVVAGLPASGKSILAGRLQVRLSWPLLAKDDYKELLFETLGTGDRAWSKRLSQAAYALMFAETRRWLARGQSCIVEGNFRWLEQAGAFAALDPLNVRYVQVLCRATPQVLVRRFRERAATRHPGHADLDNLSELESELRSAAQEPLPLPGHVEVCDTTDDWSAAIDRTIANIELRLRQED